jgi:hypothetical protein
MMRHVDRSKNLIQIRGAGEHNLKSLDVDIPRDELVVITGVSGSGKSSLAFDTIFAEGQRKYMESLSAYARQFLNQWQKPDVESIEGLPPTIAIEQRSGMHNPRSTVATITEIYDYLRLLFLPPVALCPLRHAHVLGGDGRLGADEAPHLRPADLGHQRHADRGRSHGLRQRHEADALLARDPRQEGLPRRGRRGPPEARIRAGPRRRADRRHQGCAQSRRREPAGPGPV